MKTLTIAIKSTSDVMGDFVKSFKAVSERKISTSHYTVSFDNKRDFDRFVKNINLLSLIHSQKPKSVYELAKMTGMDVSNLNKVILFFETAGVIRLKRTKIQGRTVTQPIVEYGKIEFDLAA